MTGVYEEARAAGTLGPSGVALLYETVDAVRRFSRYPPPPGYDRWDATSVAEIAHDFLSGPTRIVGVLARAIDDPSLERLLEVSVRNYLRSEYRRTEQGRMLRSLRRVVENDDAVITVGVGAPAAGCWSLPVHAGVPAYAGPLRDLVNAAFSVSGVRRARWREDARTRPPIAEPESLRRVVGAVLVAAASPVSPAVMLRVIAARFPVADAVSVVPLTDVLEERTPDRDASSPATRLVAEEIWDQLSENERLVVGILDESVRDIASETGLSRGSAHRAVLAAKAVLAEHLDDEDEALGVIGELRALSDLLRENGTRRARLASQQGEVNQ